MRNLFDYSRHDYPRDVRVRLATRSARKEFPQFPASEHARLGEAWVADVEYESHCESQEAKRYEERAYGYD